KLVEALGDRRLDQQPPAEARPAVVEAPLDVRSDGPFVAVTLGEGLARTMLLDTGEESITVSAGTAKALGLEALAEFPSVTAQGVTRMQIVLLPSLKVGGFE